jgi:hypothetical protein
VAGLLHYISIEAKEGSAKKLYEAMVWEKYKGLEDFKPVETNIREDKILSLNMHVARFKLLSLNCSFSDLTVQSGVTGHAHIYIHRQPTKDYRLETSPKSTRTHAAAIVHDLNYQRISCKPRPT